mmetsp:Transcript_16038/g.31023  ORF Transcript_16038/g.31023 Transcript_16038/m.31023 type:complete len:129 (+) Transcript_16038:286-672(+)
MQSMQSTQTSHQRNAENHASARVKLNKPTYTPNLLPNVAQSHNFEDDQFHRLRVPQLDSNMDGSGVSRAAAARVAAVVRRGGGGVRRGLWVSRFFFVARVPEQARPSDIAREHDWLWSPERMSESTNE